jgi:hypothetical protein
VQLKINDSELETSHRADPWLQPGRQDAIGKQKGEHHQMQLGHYKQPLLSVLEAARLQQVSP